MQQSYQFQTASKLIAGKGMIENLCSSLKEECNDLNKVLLITRPSMTEYKFYKSMLKSLEDEGVQVDIVTDIELEPSENHIESIKNRVKYNDYDFIVGLGGGSVLDTAKLLSVLLSNNCTIQDILGTDLVKLPGIKTALIPTTAGTGSEVTPNSIVTFPEKELKIGIVSKYLFPTIALLDPEITVTLPKKVTAATGMDAFTHAFESFISNKANYFSDMFALESIRLISDSIVESYENGTNVSAREKMLVGSMYGGMALTSAGTAAVHALAYPLGGKFDIPHGVANSMLLPHVTEYNLDSIIDRMPAVANAMSLDISTLSELEIAKSVIKKMEEWIEKLNIPQDLKEYGVSESHLKDISIAASKVTRLLDNNPKQMNLEDIENVYKKLL